MCARYSATSLLHTRMEGIRKVSFGSELLQHPCFCMGTFPRKLEVSEISK